MKPMFTLPLLADVGSHAAGSRARPLHVGLGVLLALVATSACSDAETASCPAGTTLDSAGTACVAMASAPGAHSGSVVDRVDMGHVSFTQIDVPDVLKASYPQKRSLSVTNNTAEAWGPFMLRAAISKRCVGELNGYLNHLDRDDVGCTNTCATANNGACDDGWPGPHDGACQPGTDCADCGVRGSEWMCKEAPLGAGDTQTSCAARGCLKLDGAACQCDPLCRERGDCCSDYANSCPRSSSCQTHEYCESQVGMCHPEVFTLGSAMVRGLAAGASQLVELELSLPPNWTDEGDYAFMILFDEEPLVIDGAGNVAHDPDVPKPLPGMTPFHLASAVFVHETEIRTQVDPPTIDADIKLATNMLELDDSMMSTRPALVANMSFSSLGMPAHETTWVSWKLKLPGHKLDRGTYDAASPSGEYDAERTFVLAADVVGTKFGADFILAMGGKPSVPQGVFVDRSSNQTAREGTTVDRVYALHLHRTDVGALGETLKLRSANPGLNGNDEIEGMLVTEVVTTYKGDTLRRVFETPVVFKAPEVAFEDAPTNTVPKVAKPLDLTVPGDVANDVFPDVLEEYPEVDHITPTWYKSYGGPWLGAEAQVRNFTSKGRYQDAVVRQNFVADNFLRIYLFNFRDGAGNPQPFPLLEIAAHVDQGTYGRDSIQENVANAMVRVPATRSDILPGLVAIATGDASVFDMLSNTLLDADMADRECETVDGVETCQILTKGDDAPPDYLATINGTQGYDEEPDAEGPPEEEDPDLALNISPGEITVEYTREKEKRVCKPIPEIGPFCVTGKLSASFGVGIRGTLAFFRETYPVYDPLEQPEIFQGVQASLGPTMSASATASGTLSLLVTGITLSGTVTFIDAELVPTLRLGLAQELKTQGVPEPCWRRNTGRVQFLGPASLKIMYGSVDLEAWVGLYIETFFGDIDLRQKVLDFTLYEFPPLVDLQWELWNTSVDFRKEGLCPGLDTAGTRWASPLGCKSVKGEDSYCPKGMGGDGWDTRYNYAKRLYTGPSQCGRLVIEGNLEPHGFDKKLEALIGDYVEVETGPSTQRAGGGVALTNPNYTCARYNRDTREFSRAAGTVVCGQFDSDDAQRATTAHHWKYSGEFNNFTLDFCKQAPSEYFRWVVLKLRSDSVLANKGLAVRLETQEGIEQSVYSKGGWESSALVEPWVGHPEELDFAYQNDYFAATRVAAFNDAPFAKTVSAPFTATDAAATEWLWPPYTTRSGARFSPTFARFRRPFLAVSDEYYVRIYCAPGLQCMASVTPPLPSKLLVSNTGLQPPQAFQYQQDGKFHLGTGGNELKVRTRRGEPHLLYIEARNLNNNYDPGNPPWQGVAVMMKPVE